MKKDALFDGWIVDLVTGERRWATKAELREAHRLWWKHRDVRTLSNGTIPSQNISREP